MEIKIDHHSLRLFFWLLNLLLMLRKEYLNQLQFSTKKPLTCG